MASQETDTAPEPLPRISVVTWNMDHWRRTVEDRRKAWSYLASHLCPDVALLQECVVPKDLPRSRFVYRPIAGNRPWGSAVAVFDDDLSVQEIDTVRTKYSTKLFPMLGTFPGAMIVARVQVPQVGPITFVSVYGLMDVYAQTTMFRIVADLIPLFDSTEGERVVFGGDLNVSTCSKASTELRRYEAVLKAVESLGLINVAETAAERPAQLENCLCGASSCHHLRTYGSNPGYQLDWLFATPELARRCCSVRVESDVTASLSDHAPIIADFLVPPDVPRTRWDTDSFVREVCVHNGSEVGNVAESIIEWAQSKHVQLKNQHPYAALDRLPISDGPDPELWIQLDFRYPERLGYTISLLAKGVIKLQFQYMKAPPFDAIDARRRLFHEVSALPGVALEERLNGRPSFSMAALAIGDNLVQFLKILDDAIDQMVTHHKRSRQSSQSSSPESAS